MGHDLEERPEMVMKKLNWFDRISLVEIVGEVTQKENGRRVDYACVTMYDLTGDDGVVYKCALLGIQKSPDLGDRLKIHMMKSGSIIHREEYIKIQNSDGSNKVITEIVTWRPIERYEILEE